MFKKTVFLLIVLAMVFSLAACGGARTPTPAPAAPAAPTAAPAAPAAPAAAVKELVIWWAQWDPANFLQEIGDLYEQETGIKVNWIRLSSGETLARLRAEKENPQADVWWGGTVDPHSIAAV